MAIPLVLGNSALALGHDVVLWLTLEGVNLAKSGAVDTIIPKGFPPVKELLEAFIEGGGRIGVCPPCGKVHGITNDSMIEHVEWMGAAAMIELARDRTSFSF
ncbi:MAG: DsrE family protein [Gammaproteobacteria bacterium]|nr:DsrE family protein [Gammaproteobacteria bacterium]